MFKQQVTFLYVQDRDRSLEFYRDTLCLQVALEQVSCTILTVDAGHRAFIGLCSCEEKRPTPGAIVTLVADDLPAWHARLLKAGFKPESKPKYSVQFNITHFFVKDPDGHRVEIQTFHDSDWPTPR